MSALGSVVTFPASRTDAVTVTPGSPTVLDASAATSDEGRAVTGTGIPAGTVVGNVDVGVSFSLYNPYEQGVVVNATAVGTSVTLGGILVFQFFDGLVWSQLQKNSGTYPLNPQYYLSGNENTPVPLLIVIPASAVYFGGAGVTSSTGGANLDGVPSLAYNAVGGDSLFAVVASSTATLQVLAQRQ
jgi:hypothetical protein